jgi:micrococcal nuclease
MRRFAASVFVVVALLVGSVSAASLPLSVISLTSPVAPFTHATLQARTVPGATCDITVIYKSGPSVAQGLVPRQADTRGDVTWRWMVGSNTTPGRWPILVACSKGQDVAELETAFEVRR